MGDIEKYAERFDIKNTFITVILSAIGFLTALTWRDAIKDTIDTVLPAGEGLYYKYLAAIVVTMIAVAVTFILVQIKKMNVIPDEFQKIIKEETLKRLRIKKVKKKK